MYNRFANIHNVSKLSWLHTTDVFSSSPLPHITTLCVAARVITWQPDCNGLRVSYSIHAHHAILVRLNNYHILFIPDHILFIPECCSPRGHICLAPAKAAAQVEGQQPHVRTIAPRPLPLAPWRLGRGTWTPDAWEWEEHLHPHAESAKRAWLSVILQLKGHKLTFRSE